MKRRFPTILRNILISTVVLLVLFVSAGIGYTWYMGQNNTVDATVLPETTKNTTETTLVHTLPSADIAESASVQSIVSPILPGSNSSITVRTKPFSTCTISVTYNKIPSTDSGLINKDADDYGMVTWSWTVENSVPLGKWPVKVTCASGEKSAVVVGDLEVVAIIKQ